MGNQLHKTSRARIVAVSLAEELADAVKADREERQELVDAALCVGQWLADRGLSGRWDRIEPADVLRSLDFLPAPERERFLFSLVSLLGHAAFGGKLEMPKPIFPRIEPEKQQELIASWLGQTPPAASAAPAATPAEALLGTGEVTIEEFARIDLRAAKVLAAEAVPKTEKLLKLVLDLGGEERTVVSGIAGAYAPADLVGRTVLYFANLKPAKIRGVVSQGMILAASSDPLSLCAFDRDVAPGTKVK